MPADEAVATAPAAGESTAGEPPSPESRGCILVVDDNEDNVDVLRVRLDSWGYSTHAATNGAEALAYVQQSAPDLILLDVMMPDITGIEVARRIKGNRSLPFIPIIALTAHALASDREKAMEVGCDGYLAKPCEPRAVVDEVQRFLGKDAAQNAG